MPEGPEVASITDCLRPMLEGRTIISFNVLDCGQRPQIRLGTVRPQSKIVRVLSRGKKMIWILDDNSVIMTAFIMNGRWSYEGGYSPATSNVLLIMKIGDIYGRFSMVRNTLFFSNHREPAEVAHYPSIHVALTSVGRCIISEDVTWDCYCSAVQKYKNRQVCEFLLAQDIFAGVGNYLKSDILYESRIRPDRVTSSLSNDEHNILYQNMIRLVRESYSQGGLTIRTYWAPDGRRGVYKKRVYDRSVDDLGNPVTKDSLKGRVTYWVPSLQY